MIFMKTIPIRQFSAKKETYLLHACLSENRDSIIEYLHKWKNEQDFDLIEKSTYRLIPLLEKQVRKFQIEDLNISLYKGIYRKCWMKNKILFHELVKICNHLQNNGIPVMVLKGAALSVLYYKDNGLRPMDDADIWVPFESLEQALEILHKSGWYPRFNISKENIVNSI